MSRATLSSVQRIPLITQDSGKNIGSVTHLYLNEQTKQLSALGFKYRRTNEEAFVTNDAITLVGQDVVLIDSETSVLPTPQTESAQGPGRQLRKLRGTRVTTRIGKHLGNIEDFDINPRDRKVSELHMAGGLSLPVSAAEIVIGPDEIIVPPQYEKKIIEDPERKGFLARVRTWTELAATRGSDECKV